MVAWTPMMHPDFQTVIAGRRRDMASFLAQALGPARAFVWEVGSGHGHFLTAYALAHREQPCIGVDIAGDRIARALRKRDRAKLAHLHFIQGDARLFLEAIPEGVSLSAIYILFPDPWPKLRHHKHRILQPAFLQQVRRRVGEQARLYFRTDFSPYYEEARATIAEQAGWRLVDEPWPFEYETVFQQRAETHFSLIAAPE